MRKWTIVFEENGGEYHGCMDVFCHEIIRVDEKTILADGIRIVLDEPITEIREDVDSL